MEIPHQYNEVPQNASVSSGGPVSPQVTYTAPEGNSSPEIIIPVQPPDPQVLEQERQAIITFSGDKALNPVFSDTTNNSYGPVDFFDANNTTYIVDRNTGRVHFRSLVEIGPTSGTNNITMDQGYSIAETNARAKNPKFWGNTSPVVMIIKSTNTTDQTKNVLVYSWRQYYITSTTQSNLSSELAGYNNVDVTLDSRNGRVVSYFDWYLPLDRNLNLTPDLSEQQAWQYAEKFFASQGIETTGTVDETARGLSIKTDEKNNQHLTWTFYVQTTMNGFDRGGFVGIDAHDGQVVWHAMIA